jgi:hypothetical protein
MAGQSVVRFVLDGTGKAVQQVDNLKKKLLGLDQANASPAAKAAARDERQARARVGKLAKVGQLASGIGPIGQLAEIAGAATPALAAMGVAAVAGGFALRQFGKAIELGIQAIKDDVSTRYATRGSLRAAVASADQSALGSAMSQRDKLMGGNPAAITPEMVKFYSSVDKLNAKIDRANLERAMANGEGVLTNQLARARSPESAALMDLSNAAQEEIEIQREIRDRLGFFEKAFMRLVSFGFVSENTGVINAQNRASSIAFAQGP